MSSPSDRSGRGRGCFRGWLPALLLAGAACSADRELVHLRLVTGECSSDALSHLDSVQARLIGPSSTSTSPCLRLNASSVAELQQGLSGKLSFPDQSEGEYRLVLLGFDGGNCAINDEMLCASARFRLPGAGGDLSLAVHCEASGSTPVAYTQCLAP